MTKLVDAIVRGPQPYFSKEGVLFAPGQVVASIPADEVSDKDSRDIEVEVEARNGDMVKRKVPKRYAFRPLDGDTAVIAGPTTTADIATGNPDRLNVDDFLKQGADQIVASIAAGYVDDHLGAIEQQEIARRGPARKEVTAAIAARLAATHR